MRKSILVVGGAGYIGSHVLHALNQQAYPVIILDNLSTGYRQTVQTGEFILGDARDESLLTRIFETYPIDTVMHFAASTSVPESVRNPLTYYDNNTVSTLRLLQACERYFVKKFIFSSTAAVYGDTPHEPVRESHPAHPITPYGRSKLMAEQLIEDVAQQTDMRYVNLRYFNVAGAHYVAKLGQRNKHAEHLIHVALQTLRNQSVFPLFGEDYDTPDGSCIRDFIHVQDLADAHLCALDYLDQQGKSMTLNCGYGSGFSVKEIIHTLESICNVHIPIEIKPRRPGDCPMVIADNQKIQSVLNWQPQYNDIETILHSALTWEQTYYLESAESQA